MIDLHCHILHGLDDGPATLDESLAMCRMAAVDGVRVIAATPHSPGSVASRRYDPALIAEQLREINAALAAERLSLEIVAGTEICYDAGMIDQIKRGALLPYGRSRSLLIELAHNTIPPMLDLPLFNLQAAGYRIVLAHPERIIEVQHDPNRLLPLIERGVLMQLTAETLLGGQGQRMQATAETLLAHGMVHLLASDAHGLPPRRPPLLAAARARAAVLVGSDAADRLVTKTPAAVLHGQPLQLPPPRPVERRHNRLWPQR